MQQKNRRIILIGGAPTTGKSTLAQLVSTELGIPWISTDQIRSILRLSANRKDNPALFDEEGYTAERFLTEFSAEQIVKKEMNQAEEVWPAVKMLIDNEYTWNEGFIIEGVSILPHLVAKDFQNATNIKTVFLIDEDADRILDVALQRGIWDDAATYSDEVKRKEVEWVRLFSHIIREEASHYGYACIEVEKQKNDLHVLLTTLGLNS